MDLFNIFLFWPTFTFVMLYIIISYSVMIQLLQMMLLKMALHNYNTKYRECIPDEV